MSAQSKSIECKLGSSCQYKKEGKCFFLHSEQAKVGSASVKMHKSVSVGKQLITRKPRTAKAKNIAKEGNLHHPAFLAMKKNRLARTEVFAKYKMDMSSYFDVKSGTDVKLAPAANSLFERELKVLDDEFQVLLSAARSAIGGQHIKVKLYVSNSISSGATSAIAGFYGVGPAGSSEWTSLIALYDECRVDAIHMKHIVGISVAPGTQPPGGIVPYAISWDPDYGTIPTNVRDVQESKFAALHVAGVSLSFSLPLMPHAMNEFRAKIPHNGPVLNSDMKTTPNFPGSWMNCLDPADTAGYVRYYCDALPASGVTNWYQNMCMECEFRIRT